MIKKSPNVVVACRYNLALNHPDRRVKYSKTSAERSINGIFKYYSDNKKRVVNMFDYFTGKINKEKESNLVIENGKYATEEEIKNRKKEYLKYFENSNLWLGVLSFNNDYIDSRIKLDDLEQVIIKKVMPKFLSYCGFTDIDKMSYQDVKDFLDELQAERDKESKDKLSQMEFNQSNFSLVPINSYEEMHSKYGGRATGDGSSDKYAGGGGTAWCHTNNEGVYNGWTQGGNKFFVLQNNNWKDIPFDRESNKENPKDTYGNSLIALLVDKRHGTLKRATLRCNHVGVNSNADNQYKTYAELSEVAGFNVEEEIAKYIVKAGGAVELDPSEVVSVDLLDVEEASLFIADVLAYSTWWWL